LAHVSTLLRGGSGRDHAPADMWGVCGNVKTTAG
jgi:hypothetical protein